MAALPVETLTSVQAKGVRDGMSALFKGRVIVASDTLTSDATLEIDSVTFGTNQTTAAQAILDQAATEPIHVIWDVAISCTGLRVRSNTHITALPGCGAILRSASNKPLLSNYNPTAGTIVDENIVIDGGIWNGNGAAANQSHDTVGEGWIVGIRMMGVRNVTLKNLTVLRTRTFGVHFANWERVACIDVFCDVHDDTFNHDGLHFNGPGQYGFLRGITGYCDDDVVAINANDITSQADGSGSVYGPYAAGGDITDMVIEGVHLQEGRAGVRILSSTNRIDRIQIRSVTGTVTGQAVIIDSYSEGNWRMGPPGHGNVGTVLIDGLDVVLDGTAYKETIVWVQTNIEQLRLKNVTRTDFDLALPTLKIGEGANIGQLILDGWVSMPAGLTNNANAANQVTNAGRIGSLQILGSNFARPDAAASGSPIQNTGTIRQLQVDGVQASGWASFVSNTGTITIDNSTDVDNDVLTGHWTIESGLATQNPYDIGQLLLTPPTSDVKVAYVTASDAFSGNVLVSAQFNQLAGTIEHYLFARGATVAPWSGSTAYYVGVQASGDAVIYKNTAGTASLKASLATALTTGGPYRMIITCEDSGADVIVTMFIQRVSDGYYLNPSKVFVAPTEAGTAVLTWTDTSSPITGAGKCGITEFTSVFGQTATVSEFHIQAAP